MPLIAILYPLKAKEENIKKGSNGTSHLIGSIEQFNIPSSFDESSCGRRDIVIRSKYFNLFL